MVFYKVKHHKQGTLKWQIWHRKTIGASDAEIILGLNKYKSISQLIDEKLGLITEFEGNPNTEEYKFLLPKAKLEIEKIVNFKIKPVIIQDYRVPYLVSSIEGIDKSNKYLFKIKCGKKIYEETLKQGTIPVKFYAQLQHILMVSRKPFMYFCAFRPELPLLMYKMFKDKSFIKILRYEEIKFAKNLGQFEHKLLNRFYGIKIN